MNGLALYSKKGKMYVFEVAYEYADSMYVGFRKKDEPYQGNFYIIKPEDGIYKIYKMNLSGESRNKAPIGKKYTQLPGGGGGYKATRQYTNPAQMIQNSTVKGILDRFFGIEEVRKNIRKEVDSVFENQMKKKKKTHIDFVGAMVEQSGEVAKLDNLVNKHINIPEGWKITPDFHMTITKDSGEFELKFGDRKRIIDKDVDLKIVAIGRSDKAIAFKEEGDMWSRKDPKHITVAYLETPRDSDDITEWEYFSSPVIVKSTIRQIDEKKNVIHDIQLDERGSAINIGNFPNSTVPAGKIRAFPQEK